MILTPAMLLKGLIINYKGKKHLKHTQSRSTTNEQLHDDISLHKSRLEIMLETKLLQPERRELCVCVLSLFSSPPISGSRGLVWVSYNWVIPAKNESATQTPATVVISELSHTHNVK